MKIQVAGLLTALLLIPAVAMAAPPDKCAATLKEATAAGAKVVRDIDKRTAREAAKAGTTGQTVYKVAMALLEALAKQSRATGDEDDLTAARHLDDAVTRLKVIVPTASAIAAWAEANEACDEVKLLGYADPNTVCEATGGLSGKVKSACSKCNAATAKMLQLARGTPAGEHTIEELIETTVEDIDSLVEGLDDSEFTSSALAARRRVTLAKPLKTLRAALQATLNSSRAGEAAWEVYDDLRDGNYDESIAPRLEELLKVEPRTAKLLAACAKHDVESEVAGGQAPRAGDDQLARPKWAYSGPAGVEFTVSEVTVAEFDACLGVGGCSRSGFETRSSHASCNMGYPDRQDHPMTCVDRDAAAAFCRWAGGRLPSEQEWYAEASDQGTRNYPWGNAPVDCRLAVWASDQPGAGCGRKSRWPVCSRPEGNSVSGLCDMAGNAWEWTGTSADGGQLVRGGLWTNLPSSGQRVPLRMPIAPSTMRGDLGFRCVRARQAQNTEGGATEQARAVPDSGLTWFPIPGEASKAFMMAKTETTNAQYRRCVDAAACEPAHAADGTCRVWRGSNAGWGGGVLAESFLSDEQPVVCVDHDQAAAFCQWAGGRLPTLAEWRHAARSGKEDQTYPWGNTSPSCQVAVLADTRQGCGRNATWPVCAAKAGNSAQGVCDLVGNVSEWLDTPVDRGGDWTTMPFMLNNLGPIRRIQVPRSAILGFRCVKDAP